MSELRRHGLEVGHVHLLGRRQLLHADEAAHVQGALHPVELEFARGGQVLDVGVEFARGDRLGDLVDFRNELDGGVAIGIVLEKGHAAVERIEGLLHDLGTLGDDLVGRDPACGRMGGHRRAVIDQRAGDLLVNHLVGQRRVEDGGVDVAGDEVGDEAAAAQGHAGEVDLLFRDRPERQDIGAGARGGDADLLASEFGHVLDLGVGFDDQVPAVIPVGAVGDAADLHALEQPGRHARRGIEDEIGCAGCQRLEAFRAAPIHRQFRLDALLVEELLAQRRLGDDRRPIGLGRQADANDVRLGPRNVRKCDGRGAASQHTATGHARPEPSSRHGVPLPCAGVLVVPCTGRVSRRGAAAMRASPGRLEQLLSRRRKLKWGRT